MQVTFLAHAVRLSDAGFGVKWQIGNVPVTLDLGVEAELLIRESRSLPLVTETQNASRQGFRIGVSDQVGMPRVIYVWVNQKELEVYIGPKPGEICYDTRTGEDNHY